MKTDINERTVTLSKVCTVSNKTYSITIDIDKYYRWKSRRYLIQDVFPELTIEEREFMISGNTPEEWKMMFCFGELDDDE